MIHAFKGLLRRGRHVKNGLNIEKPLLSSTQLNTKLFSLSNATFRPLHEKGDGKINRERQMPMLVYLQNPITWLINKLDLKMLRSAWDPEFNENDFKRGTIQAISVICQLISRNMWDGLRGLLNRQALARLQRDVELTWSDQQRRNISIEPSNIKLALPRKVHFLRVAEKKFVDIDMMFVAMKFKEVELPSDNDIIFIELVARFHRNYTFGEIPNWTVTLFKLTRFTGAS